MEHLKRVALNIVVKWLTLLLCIWEVPDSNLGSETCCNDCSFSWFYSVPGILLEGLGKTKTKLNLNILFLGQDLNPGPPEYEAVLLMSHLQYLFLP
jgi:hypothetical protein